MKMVFSMLNRQRMIMALLRKAGGTASRLSLMKWSFLISKEGRSKLLNSFYQFLPYKYGPYSFNLMHELESLKQNGYISADGKHDYSISSIARKEILMLDKSLSDEVNVIWMKYGNLSSSKLINLVYDKYPWYSLRSNIESKRNICEVKAELKVYTVGYEGLQIDGFLNLILRAGMTRIIDVRHNPISRNYGFHQSTLSRLSNYLDIEYVHFPSVGIPSNLRQELNNVEDYDELLSKYQQEILHNQREVIHKIGEYIKEKPSVLMCQEADPDMCHRSILAKYISHLIKLPIYELRVFK